ncbi:MAG: hypothetical protein WDW38_009826 [Sanguina aurantia]
MRAITRVPSVSPPATDRPTNNPGSGLAQAVPLPDPDPHRLGHTHVGRRAHSQLRPPPSNNKTLPPTVPALATPFHSICSLTHPHPPPTPVPFHLFPHPPPPTSNPLLFHLFPHPPTPTRHPVQHLLLQRPQAPARLACPVLDLPVLRADVGQQRRPPGWTSLLPPGTGL